MEQRPERDFSQCPKCGGTEVERTEVTRGYYSAHARLLFSPCQVRPRSAYSL
jgi:hypothetical protein